MAPHAYSKFDPTRHLVSADLEFKMQGVHIGLKWSKTMQNRDKIYTIVLPKLYPSVLCLVTALKKALAEYNPAPYDPFFQVRTSQGFKCVTETKLHEVLSQLNVNLGFHPLHFSFHTFRHSGASCAYNEHVSVQSIKTQGSWASDCVWTYIQQG